MLLRKRSSNVANKWQELTKRQANLLFFLFHRTESVFFEGLPMSADWFCVAGSVENHTCIQYTVKILDKTNNQFYIVYKLCTPT